MEEALQYKETAQFIGLPTASPRSHRDHGDKAGHALTFKTDHSMGADQFLGDIYQAEGVARELRNQMLSQRTPQQSHDGLAWLYGGP